MTLPPGIHPRISEAVYHADPADGISASASILRTLYDASPEHAAYDHPKLNPNFKPAPSTDAQANGSILHAAVLGQPPPYRALEFDNFYSSAAKEAKAAAIKSGFLPILRHKLDELLPVADALRARLIREFPKVYAALTDPETIHEATVIASLDGVLCRCRFDVLPPARFGFTADFKFTGRSAEPEEWSRKLREMYLFQGDFYPRCLKATRGDAPEFRFVVCETDPPYGVSVHALNGDLAQIARRRVTVALRRWSWCLRDGIWPGYPPGIHYAEAPGYMITQDDAAASRDNWLMTQGIYKE
jgi:hypothetical protein